MTHTIEQYEKVQELLQEDSTIAEIASVLGINPRSVYRVVEQFGSNIANERQKIKDLYNKETKVIREKARQENVIEAIETGLMKVLKTKSFEAPKTVYSQIELKENDYVGVIQLSDIHFNEIIDDLDGNKFDFEVASKRLYKLAETSIRLFKSHNIDNIALFMTGDLLNSDRRLDEVVCASTNRSNAIFIATDILQQFINHLLTEFKRVTVATVSGNESRVGEFINYSNFLAGDNYDIVIHNILKITFIKNPNVTFCDITNPVECVVDVNGNNILLVHGHAHGRFASNMEKQVHNLMSKYIKRGVVIHYVLCGHIHCSQISDLYSRSSGLPGNNSYSERALNLDGRSAQNIFIVGKNRDILGIKVDLQNYQNVGYKVDDFSNATSKQSTPANVIIQKVLV